MTVDRALEYEIFISYCRRDNQPDGCGWVTALCDQIQQDHRRFSTEPLRIFFDKQHIADMDDWRDRILGGLRSSQILLVCLSPAYFHSEYCRWEWEEYGRRHIHQLIGHEGIAPVYFVEVPGSDEQQNVAEFERWVQSIRPWMDEVMGKNCTDIRPWFPAGLRALQEAEVQRRMAKLGESLWQRIQRARRAAAARGNLRRQSPYFVGRRKELHQLHQELSGGRVGVVTAVHGLGGQGKTELAIAYGHGFADWYPAGLWKLGAEGKTDLLSLVGELAFVPDLDFTSTEAQKADQSLLSRAVLAELQRRSEAAAGDRQPGQSAAGLLIPDNVSEASLLSSAQLATLPQATWLQVVATTRLDPARLPTAGRNLARVAVDSLLEEDALALVRDHQPLSESIHDLLVRQAWAVYDATSAPEPWELDGVFAALPPRLRDEPVSQRLAALAEAATFASDKFVTYRTLTDAKVLLFEAHCSQQRLAEADPGNAGWQRDLWVSCWRVGSVTEQTVGEARPWWRRAYDVLSAMKERGLFVSADDEQFLAQLEEKIRG